MEQKKQVDVADRNAEPDRFEERRLVLEFERLKLERQRASIEFLLKRRELNAAKNNKGWKDILGNPLTLAVVGGFITLMTTTITSHFSASDSVAAEAAKAQQALQADLIKKFVENPDPQTVRANLRFLVDVGLVPTYAASLRSFLDKNPNSALPSAFTPGVFRLQNVHTDDDAIDLVLRFEGGFVDDPRDPGRAMKFGITLVTLSSYLGKQATVDDLRNLSVEAARDIYKKLYLTGAASNIASVQTKAAYLGLAATSGTGRANRLFQVAIAEIDKLPGAEDGVLGPDVIQRINAADQDLLIETVNCEALKFYKSLSAFRTFGPGWIHRLRAFSPTTLKGICPELQAN